MDYLITTSYQSEPAFLFPFNPFASYAYGVEAYVSAIRLKTALQSQIVKNLESHVSPLQSQIEANRSTRRHTGQMAMTI